MVKQCASYRQAFPSSDDHQTCADCRYAVGTCQLDVSNPCQACQGWCPKTWGKLRKSLQDARAKSARRGTHQWTTTVPSLDTWLEGLSTSSDLISEVNSIKESEIMEFVDNSDNVGVSTVREVEVSVHQRPVGVTFAILVTEQAPSMNTMIPAPQCATLSVCAPLPLQGPTVNAPLLVQSTSVAAPMLSTFLSLGTRAPITMQGLAFPPMASTPVLFPEAPAAVAPYAERRCSVRARLTLVHTWLLLGPCSRLVTCLGPKRNSLPHKLNVSNLLCNIRNWRLES